MDSCYFVCFLRLLSPSFPLHPSFLFDLPIFSFVLLNLYLDGPMRKFPGMKLTIRPHVCQDLKRQRGRSLFSDLPFQSVPLKLIREIFIH